jgi:hypothetical protein
VKLPVPSSSIRFHDKFTPTAFTISENGEVVVEGRTTSVADPPARTEAMFDIAGLVPIGAGRPMNPGRNMTIPMSVPGQPFPVSAAGAAIRAVTLHGKIGWILLEFRLPTAHVSLYFRDRRFFATMPTPIRRAIPAASIKTLDDSGASSTGPVGAVNELSVFWS